MKPAFARIVLLTGASVRALALSGERPNAAHSSDDLATLGALYPLRRAGAL